MLSTGCPGSKISARIFDERACSSHSWHALARCELRISPASGNAGRRRTQACFVSLGVVCLPFGRLPLSADFLVLLFARDLQWCHLPLAAFRFDIQSADTRFGNEPNDGEFGRAQCGPSRESSHPRPSTSDGQIAPTNDYLTGLEDTLWAHEIKSVTYEEPARLHEVSIRRRRLDLRLRFVVSLLPQSEHRRTDRERVSDSSFRHNLRPNPS